MTLSEVLAEFANEFDGCKLHEVDIPLAGRRVTATMITIEEGLAELYVVDNGFWPETPPVALMNWGDGKGSEVLSLSWDLSRPAQDRLLNAFRGLLGRSCPRILAYGSSMEEAVAMECSVAAELGLRRFLPSRSQTFNGRAETSRVEPSLFRALKSSKVAVVGLGSVGSFVVEHLSRSGVARFVLIDDDIVEASNLSRTAFSRSDLGGKKVHRIAMRVKSINPGAEVIAIPERLECVPPAVLRDEFSGCDMILAATDDPATQLTINRCAYFLDCPSMYIGLYEEAKAGEIFTIVPGLTPCLMCMVGSVRESLRRETGERHSLDYGSGRILGGIALGCDIHHVCTAGIKMIIGMLSVLKGEDDTSAGRFALGALRANLPLAILSMEPAHWFFPDLFRGVSGQYAFGAAWFRGEKDSACPVCSRPFEDDPFESLRADVNLGSIRREIGL